MSSSSDDAIVRAALEGTLLEETGSDAELLARMVARTKGRAAQATKRAGSSAAVGDVARELLERPAGLEIELPPKQWREQARRRRGTKKRKRKKRASRVTLELVAAGAIPLAPGLRSGASFDRALQSIEQLARELGAPTKRAETAAEAVLQARAWSKVWKQLLRQIRALRMAAYPELLLQPRSSAAALPESGS